MGIFTRTQKSDAAKYLDARLSGDNDLALEIYYEMALKIAQEEWNKEGFIMFIDNIKWEEVDGF